MNNYGSRLSTTPGAFTGITQDDIDAYNRVFSGAGKPVQNESTFGRLASATFSGQSFIKELSGYDIDNLPGYISTPIDILASPVGLASLAAAIPSGGTSLGAAAAGSVGRRLAARAAVDVASGIVGAKAGELVGEYTPGPDWLKTGAGLATGIAAGGITGSIGGKMLAGNLAKAAAIKETLPLGMQETYTGYPKSSADPLRLLDPNSAKPIDAQIVDVVKEFSGKGIRRIPVVSDIIDSFKGNQGQITKLADEINLLALDAMDEIGITYGTYGKGRAPLIEVNGVKYPAQSVLDNPSKYGAEEIVKPWKKVENALTELKAQHNRATVGGRTIGDRATTGPDGLFAPRGNATEDGMDIFAGAPVYEKTRIRGGTPGTARGIKYENMEDALNNGVSYPPLNEAVKNYVITVGGSINGSVASRRLLSITDEAGNYIMGTPEMFIDPELKAEYFDISGKYIKAQNDFTITRQESEKVKALINEKLSLIADTKSMAAEAAKGGFDVSQFEATISDAEGELSKLRELLNTHDTTAMALYDQLNGGLLDTSYKTLKGQYDEAIGGVTRRPDLSKIEGLAPLNERGEVEYAPRAIADAINSALNPNGLIATTQKLTRSFNDPLKVFHQLVDISDFGRLLPTMGVMHPFDSFKGIKAGINTMFKGSAVLDALNDGDKRLRDAGITNYNWRKFSQMGMPLVNPDIDLSILNKMGKAGEGISKISNITQSGIAVMRNEAVVTELINKAKAGIPITDDVVESAIKAVNLTSGVPNARLSTPVDLMIQYPRWLQSQIEFVINAAAGMIPGAKYEQQYARNALLRLVALGMATTYGVNALQGRDTKVTNERGEFVVPTMRVGNQELNMFGPYGALVNGMYQALKPNGSIEPLLRSRVTPLIGLGWDLGSGSTYMNDMASWNDPTYWAKFAAPYSVSNLFSQDKFGVSTLLQGVGVRAQPVSAYKQLLETAESTMGKPWAELSGQEKEKLRIANPELTANLERLTLQRAKDGDRGAQATLALQEATQNLLQQQENMGNMWKAGQISSTELRDQLENLMYKNAGEKQAIYKAYGLDKTTKAPSVVKQALDGYYDLFKKADRGILAGGTAIGLPDWDALDKLKADYMSTLTPTQQQAVNDRFIRTAPALDWYYKNKEIIQNSGFFDNRQKAIDELKSTVRQAVPGAENYSDILEAYAKAERTGNRAAMARINGVLNVISNRSQVYDNEMIIKNPRLYKALVENGYRKQAAGRPLAASIPE